MPDLAGLLEVWAWTHYSTEATEECTKNTQFETQILIKKNSGNKQCLRRQCPSLWGGRHLYR